MSEGKYIYEISELDGSKHTLSADRMKHNPETGRFEFYIKRTLVASYLNINVRRLNINERRLRDGGAQ